MLRHAARWTVLGLCLGSANAFAADPYTFIVLPDTQNYADFVNENNTYNIGDMNWIVANRSAMNIKFVMHLGDHQNPGNPYRARTDNIYEPDFTKPLGDVNDKLAKWGRASAAVDVLDNAGVPYSLVPGNHDYLDHDTKTEPYMYLKTFGPSRRYESHPKFDEKGNNTYGGASPALSATDYGGMNTYHRVYAGGYTWLNIALQDKPDNTDLAWAQRIINANPNMPTIVTTHEFVQTAAAANDFQHAEIWETLIQNNPQIVMSFNGHLTGENRVTRDNIAGRATQMMLVDYQADQFDAELGGNYYKGAGILRTVQVNQDANRVFVKSYSPVANKFLTDGNSQFDFDLNMKTRFGLPDGRGDKGSISFRNGTSGYTGGRDSMISEAATGTNYGEDPSINIDGDLNGGESQAVVRFDSIFGSSLVPTGSIIEKATLRLHTSEITGSATGNTIRLYRMLRSWTEGGITWNSMQGGLAADGTEAIIGENGAVIPNILDGFVTFDVTESLAAWSTGAPNNGWVLLTSGNNEWIWDTSEAANIEDRPLLSVDFHTNSETIPEPASFALLALSGVAFVGRRRR